MSQSSGPTTGFNGVGMSSPASLIPFLFGCSRLEAFPGTPLIRLLGDLGMGETAARTTLARLRASGSLTSTRVGRRSQYRLSGPMKAAFERARERPEDDRWDGGFHGIIYGVPERDRYFRDMLRLDMTRLGYAPLRPGLMISPRDRFDGLAQTLETMPAGAYAMRSWIGLTLADARESAERAWSLKLLEREYGRQAKMLQRLSKGSRSIRPDAVTLRNFFQHQRTILSLYLSDPRLPSDLLPSSWPIHEVDAARRAFRETWSPSIIHYIDSVIEETGTRDIASVDSRAVQFIRNEHALHHAVGLSVD